MPTVVDDNAARVADLLNTKRTVKLGDRITLCTTTSAIMVVIAGEYPQDDWLSMYDCAARFESLPEILLGDVTHWLEAYLVRKGDRNRRINNLFLALLAAEVEYEINNNPKYDQAKAQSDTNERNRGAILTAARVSPSDH